MGIFANFFQFYQRNLRKLNEFESESDTFPRNEGQSWQIRIDPYQWALTKVRYRAARAAKKDKR